MCICKKYGSLITFDKKHDTLYAEGYNFSLQLLSSGASAADTERRFPVCTAW